ncbi:MAG: chain-length determining protein [Alteromonadaceae bacterium TMED7]|nr:chain-length determining protein [Alteromonadaceae bacterium]RPH20720.1 MAG: chain-length determining protein [Alteromonadaceae bacterium TMED7]|tara:strand:+ start:8291 stop:9865 length:1575 start_codon:yes stop_codon:yes gene_type:complete
MQELQQTIEMVLDYIRGIWLKKRYIMLCSWLICPIGFGYVAMMPDVYKSQAVVFVDTRSMLQPLLSGLAIQTNPQQEIAMMAQTLLSRSNIEIIARESDLDITVNTAEGYTNLINTLSKNIRLDRTGRNNIYNISYSNRNPELAKRVVQETLDLFVEGSLGNNRRDTDTASRFLDEQISEYETRLIEAEQRLADFQRRYNDILPVSGSFYSTLQGANSNLESTQLQIRELQQQVSSLKSQMTSGRATDGFDVRQGDNTPVITTRYDNRIKSLEEKIDQLKLRFTDKHPDVIEAKSLLASLEQSRQDELKAYFSETAEDGDDTNLSPLATELKLEISRLEGQIASLRVRESDFEAKIQELRNKIDLVPQIEAESTALNRDYGITKQKYEELLRRKEAAELSRRADVSSEELQFRIIEPPLVPDTPTGPKRLVYYTGILVLGFGMGVALAFAISQIRPVLVRGRQLTALTSFPVLGAVTHLNLKQIQRRNRLRVFLFILSSGAIVTMYAILLAAEVAHVNLVERFL